MATSSSAVQKSVQGTSSNQEAPAYEIKGKTMSLEEWDLIVQVERPIDFASLIHHVCDIVSSMKLKTWVVTSVCSTDQLMKAW